MDFAEADDKLSRILRRVVDVPSFPAVVEKLIALPEDEQSPRQFASLIATDQGLASKVLRLVNSAFFSLKTPILSVPQASSMLGVRTLRSLAQSVSVMSLFKQSRGGFDPLVLWRHSLCVAIVSRKLGNILLPSAAEDLYIAGLLHDMGVSILVHYFSEDYVKILRHAQVSGRSLWDVELSFLGTTHAELGYALASRWKLPALVCECIRHHERNAVALPRAVVQLGSALEIVRFADRWAENCGPGLVSSKETEGEECDVPDRVLAAEQDLHAILKSAATELQEKENDILVVDSSAVQHAAQVS